MASANLRISYLGGGYDFPQFFEHSEIRILAEGLPISVECKASESTATWQLSKSCRSPKNLSTGLGASSSEASLVYPSAVPTRTLARPDRRGDPT